MATKNKLKKLSPSSSRRSHEMTSSRDNMSIDSSHQDTDSQEDASPAVPSNRVQGRIRVLTSVEQLVLRNVYEREALDLLKNQTYHHVRIFEPLFFIKTGLKADMTRAFNHVGWYNFPDMTEPDAEKGASSSQRHRYNNSATNVIEHPAVRTSRALSPCWNLPHELRRNVQDSYGPQVGLSSSAHYVYENPIMRGITNLTTRVNTMGQQQDQLSIDLAHNAELTQ
ncbi:hypothetical protein C2845_PM13G07870 [Panicum miliaceum]|uniref:Uncharacterized protein n=1 Tax=Panicum miliaceum TaxID=4540 RepID=A0A3L6RJA9_PANMI|nr:hypothetical protein C2845_PM13G07870 [Panicum miliaceum]